MRLKRALEEKDELLSGVRVALRNVYEAGRQGVGGHILKRHDT